VLVYTGEFTSNSLNPDVEALPNGTRTEKQETVYDALETTDINALPAGYTTPSFLASNVAKTKNSETTTYYSYDIYGRVQWIVQDIAGLGIKTIDYEYDPITNQVHKVYYQKGKTDQFIHRYTYDAVDDSLVKVETSTNNSNYTTHASYEYYENGQLKRTELAGGLQGVDYIYNLAGQLKSINHPSLQTGNDPGNDTGIHSDLFGMQIDYHTNDYARPLSNVATPNYGTDRLDGNIKGIRWKNNAVAGSTNELRYAYEYDRNNWLTAADFSGSGTNGTPLVANIENTSVVENGENVTLKAGGSVILKAGFHAKSGSTFKARIANASEGQTTLADGDYDVSNITYDANGNIQSLTRNKNRAGGASSEMDVLSYTYKIDKPNQLLRVTDAAGDVSGADDIGTQTGNNYVYNNIGQLIENKEDGITYSYTATGLVSEIKKDAKTLVKFYYNDKNFRVKKESYNDDGVTVNYTEHYIRDASGTAMAIYRNGTVTENTVYEMLVLVMNLQTTWVMSVRYLRVKQRVLHQQPITILLVCLCQQGMFSVLTATPSKAKKKTQKQVKKRSNYVYGMLVLGGG